MFSAESRKRIELVMMLGLLSSTLVFAFTFEPVLNFPWYLMAGISFAILFGRFADNRLHPTRPSDRSEPELLLAELGEILAYSLPGAVLALRLYFPLADLASSLRFCFAGAVIGFHVGRSSPSVTGRFVITVIAAMVGFLLSGIAAISTSLDTTLGAAGLCGVVAVASFLQSLRIANETDQGKFESFIAALRITISIVIESLAMGFKLVLLSLLVIGGLLFSPLRTIYGVAVYGIVLSLFFISLRVFFRFREAVTDFRGPLLTEKLLWESRGVLFGVGTLALIGVGNFPSMAQFAIFLLIGGIVGLIVGTLFDRLHEGFRPGRTFKPDPRREKERKLALELNRRNSSTALGLAAQSQLLSTDGQKIAYIGKFFLEAGFRIEPGNAALPAFNQNIWWLKGRPDFPSARFFDQYGGVFIVFLLLNGFLRVGEDVDLFLNQARDAFHSSEPGRSLGGSMAFIVLEQPPGAGAEASIITHKLDDKFYLAPILYSTLKDAVDRQSQDTQSCFNEFARIVRENVGIDDLYDRYKPIREASDFYGRVDLLGELIQSVQSHSPVALIGISKVGKTWLLFRLQDMCQSSHTIAVYVDLRKFARDAKYVLSSIVRELGRQIQSTSDWEALAQGIEDGSQSIESTANRLLEMLAQSGQVTKPIALLFDEWDCMFPSSQVLDDGFKDWLPFIRVLSQIASSPWFVPIIAGLDATSLELQNWKSERNPLIQMFRVKSVTLFSRPECDEMVMGIGRRMGLEYDRSALAELYLQSGGHPFIARRLCSNTWRRQGGRSGPVAAETIRSSATQYARDTASSNYLEEIWQTLMVRERQILRRIAKQGIVGRDALLQGIGSEKIRREIGMYLDRLTRYSILQRDETETSDSYRIAIGVFRLWIEINQP